MPNKNKTKGKHSVQSFSDDLKSLLGRLAGSGALGLPAAAVAAAEHKNAQRSQQKKATPRVRPTQNRASRGATRRLVTQSVPGLAHSTTGLSSAVAQYLDPLNYPPVRLPDVASAQTVGTAVCALSSAFSLAWSATDSSVPAHWSTLPTTSTILPVNRTRAIFKLRDPVVALISTEFGPDTLTATPTVYSITFGAQGFGDSFAMNAGIPAVKVGQTVTSVPVALMTHSSGPHRYPDITPCCWINEHTRGFWVDASPACPAIITLSCNNRGFSSVNLSAYNWTNWSIPTPGPLVVVNAGVSVQTISIPVSGYWSIMFNAESLPGGNAVTLDLSITVSVSVAQWCSHHVHDSLLDGVSMFFDMRVLGDAVLASNTTSKFFQNGMVYARQSQDESPWFCFSQTEEEYTSLNVRELYQGRLEKGLYATVKPQGPEIADPFGMIPVIDDNNRDVELPLLGFRPFMCPGVVSVLFVPAQPVTTDSVTSLNIHYMRSMEYTTNSQLVVVDVARLPRSEFPLVLDAIAGCPQFFENPLHLSQIREKLRQIGSWAWKNKSELVSVMRIIGQLMAVAP